MSTETVHDRDLRLIAAGWKQTRTGKWLHPSLPPVQGRLRPFSTEHALTMVDGLAETPADEPWGNQNG